MRRTELEGLAYAIAMSLALWAMLIFGTILIATADPWYLRPLALSFLTFMAAGIAMIIRDV